MNKSDAEAAFSPNKTSARLLVEYSSGIFGPGGKRADPERFLLVYDLYIKARSYAIMNKIFFWFAMIGGIMVLVWPSIAVVTKDFGVEFEFLKSAIVQTTITGLAALMFAIYSHYKKRQVLAENLMRTVVLSNQSIDVLKEAVLNELRRIDTGFSFGEVLSKKGSEQEKN